VTQRNPAHGGFSELTRFYVAGTRKSNPCSIQQMALEVWRLNEARIWRWQCRGFVQPHAIAIICIGWPGCRWRPERAHGWRWTNGTT